MKITLGALRKIIKEEVERNLRYTAGFFGGSLSQPRKGIVYKPLPGLGPSTGEREEELEEHEEEQRKRAEDR